MEQLPNTLTTPAEVPSPAPVGRRSFLKYAGAATAAGALLTSCAKEDALVTPGSRNARIEAVNGVITLPGGDLGILNYAYVLEQIESRFYEMVLAKPYAGMSSYENQLFIDLKGHEVTHREFYRYSLGGYGLIPDLTLDFSSIDFNSRFSVITASRMFADLGTAAYNGGGKYLTDPINLAISGKLVSLEARHSAVLREVLLPNTDAFAGDDAIDGMGLDLKLEPREVLPMAQKYVKEIINPQNLPTA